MVSEQVTERFRWEDCLYLFSSRWYVVLLIGSLVWLAGASAKRKLPPLYEVEAHLTLQKDASGNDFDPVSRKFPTASEHDLLREAAELDSRTLLSEVAGLLDLSALWKIKDVGALIDVMTEARAGFTAFNEGPKDDREVDFVLLRQKLIGIKNFGKK